MRKILFSGVLSWCAFFSLAQSNTVATGGEASGPGGSVSYSVGQIDYVYASGANGSTNQGLQQPYEFFGDAGIFEHYGISINAYPNPTMDDIALTISKFDGDLRYRLIDLQGKLISEQQITETITIIPMSSLSAGEYHLALINANEPIHSIQIIKH